MGAWSYEVMENDYALDKIADFVDTDNLLLCIKDYLHKEHPIWVFHELLLAIEIVDISLNGIDMDILGYTYQYDKWFVDLPNRPMEELREEALQALNLIINSEDNNNMWVLDIREDRRKMLLKIKERLERR